MKFSVIPLLLIIAVLSLLASAKTLNKKHCRHRTRHYHQNQHNLFGHLRKRPDFLHGVSIDSQTAAQSEKNDGSLSCLKSKASVITPTYEMKWDQTEYQGKDIWTFNAMDNVAHWIHGHKKLLRGHTGLWDLALPNWVKQLDGPNNKAALQKALYDHVYGIVKKYGNQMIAFDVVNEPFNYSGDGSYKPSVFWRNLGYEMFVISFAAANKAKWEMKSNVKLYLNEMELEHGSGPKVEAMIKLIDKLRQLHVQVDGLGMQFHLHVDDPPRDLDSSIKVWTDKGLEVSVTELDVRIRDGDYSEESLNKQAWLYAAVYDACLANSKCKMVIRWNVDDSLSWIPEGIPGWGRATMFGPKCAIKPKIIKAVSQVLAKYA